MSNYRLCAWRGSLRFSPTRKWFTDSLRDAERQQKVVRASIPPILPVADVSGNGVALRIAF